MKKSWESTLHMGSLKLHQLIEHTCLTHAGQPAISDPHNSWTYQELWEHAGSILQLFHPFPLQAGEPVIVSVDNACFDIACFLAVWRAGGTVVPVHKNTAVATWANLVSLTTARYVLSAPGRIIYYAGSLTRLEGVLYGTPVETYLPDPLLDDAALVVFTSGTTGLPKGVVQGHSQYTRKLHALATMLQPRPGLTTLQYLQLSFSFGQWTSFLTLGLGGHLLLRPAFSAEGFQNDTTTHPGIDWVPLVPSMLRIFFAGMDRLGKAVPDRPPARCLLVGGEIMPAALGQKARHCWPATEIFDIYGLTETNSGDFILRAEEYDSHAGTIGYPSPGVAFRIMGGEGVLPVYQTGELEIASTFRMKGYLRNPELTKAIMHGDYLLTGDTGFMDDRGAVHLVGRKTDQINVGGRKVSPIEVENVYQLHPDVEACLAGAISDALLGEGVGLLVIAKRGKSPDVEMLKAWGKDRLEHYKVPGVIQLVHEFPAGKTGKADRSGIRQLIKTRQDDPQQ